MSDATADYRAARDWLLDTSRSYQDTVAEFRFPQMPDPFNWVSDWFDVVAEGNDERALVVVPTYNEAENIAWVAERLLRAVPGTDLLVVDDGSPDGTGAIADRLAATEPRVSVVHRSASRPRSAPAARRPRRA